MQSYTDETFHIEVKNVTSTDKHINLNLIFSFFKYSNNNISKLSNMKCSHCQTHSEWKQNMQSQNEIAQDMQGMALLEQGL